MGKTSKYTKHELMGKLVRVSHKFGGGSGIGYVIKHPFKTSAKRGYVCVIYADDTTGEYSTSWKEGLIGVHTSRITEILSGSIELCHGQKGDANY